MLALELLAALIGCSFVSTITKLHSHLTSQHYYWSDSEVCFKDGFGTLISNCHALQYRLLRNSRDSEIRQWKYVDTKSQCADLATKLSSTMKFGIRIPVWFTGRNFLKHEPDHWPTQSFTVPQREQAVICAHQFSESRIQRIIF
ncbi:hypothetical protein PVAND_015275 [Polypedilum vanderplanki]|uniref:Uncharacterized protein n=1 Tax=Polypedilum vanderplanki TaxID=319348 RepID=A0A9J6BBP5_POLVA|nr:hypothetical protein PVAND_015275 [Polypedilum vanderplanki]